MDLDAIMMLLFEGDQLDLNVVVNAAQQVAEPLDVGDGNEEGNERANITRNDSYFEETVPAYSEEQFKEHFRMRRNTYEALCDVVSQEMERRRTPKIGVEKKVLLTIYLLAYQISFNSAGDKFGVSASTAHLIFTQVTEIIAGLVDDFIKWPEVDQYHAIQSSFSRQSGGFPGCVGMIDGCHIPIKQPVGNAHDYYNRNNIHSVVLQGICDHQCRFIDICVGFPGRMHDARVFRNSPIHDRLMDGLLPRNAHILGDSAYPLEVFLLTPYRDNGHLNDLKINYNNMLSTIRSAIERAFGLLKSKFRRLKFIEVNDVGTANTIIAAACVLHNFLIDHGDVDFGQENFPIRNGQFAFHGDNAAIKRDQIADLLVQ